MDLSQSVGACPVCRSAKYRKTDEGFLICEFGHQSQGFWEEHEDNETYLGTTKKIQTARSSQARLSQILDDSVEVVRSGDVEKFVLLEIIQTLLKRQIQDLRAIVELPEAFETTVKSIWFTYVSCLKIEYEEEGVHEPLPSQLARRDSQISLALESERSEFDAKFSDDDLDAMMPSQDIQHRFPANEEDPSSAEISLPYGGRVRLTVTLPVLAAGLFHHAVPIYPTDLYRFLLTDKLSFFNIRDLISKEHLKLLTRSSKSFLANPSIPNWQNLGRFTTHVIRLMYAKHAIIPHPLDIRLLIWRIGEDLGLPYIFREDLIALAVKLQMELRFGMVQESSTSNPLVLAYSLVIFYLKMHYGLYDSTVNHLENEKFTKSGLPTQFQLIEVWRARLKSEECPHDYDLKGIIRDTEFYQRRIVAPRTLPGDAMVEDVQQIRRGLQIDQLIAENSTERMSTPPWLKIDPEKEIYITDFWARQYPCSSLAVKDETSNFVTWSEAYRILLELGARFCCCDPSQMASAVIQMWETFPAEARLKNAFST